MSWPQSGVCWPVGGRDGEDSRDAQALADDGGGGPLRVAQEGGRRRQRRRLARRGRDRQGDDGVSRVRQGNAAENSRSAGGSGEAGATSRHCRGAQRRFVGIRRTGKRERRTSGAESRSTGARGRAKPAAAPPATPAVAPPRKSAQGGALDRTSYAGDAGGGNGGAADGGRVLASPYVRKVAREKGIDLHGVLGTGTGGRVVAADLESIPAPAAPGATSLARVPAAQVPAALPAPVDESEVRPLSPMRKTIARRLTESKATVPHFYLSIDVDAAGLVTAHEVSQVRPQCGGKEQCRFPSGPFQAWSPS